MNQALSASHENTHGGRNQPCEALSDNPRISLSRIYVSSGQAFWCGRHDRVTICTIAPTVMSDVARDGKYPALAILSRRHSQRPGGPGKHTSRCPASKMLTTLVVY